MGRSYWMELEELAFRTEKVSHTIKAINTAMDYDKGGVNRYALTFPSDELEEISNGLTALFKKMLGDDKTDGENATLLYNQFRSADPNTRTAVLKLLHLCVDGGDAA